MADHHIHIVAPRGRGRPCAPYLRCVACAKSTRSKKFVQCNMHDAPGGRICMNCYESSTADNSVHNCHEWSKCANAPAASQCDMCAKQTDRLLPCIVCEGTVCEACINSATLERFLACGANELICNSCIPPDACADQDGRTALTLGDRQCTYCLICQE